MTTRPRGAPGTGVHGGNAETGVYMVTANPILAA